MKSEEWEAVKGVFKMRLVLSDEQEVKVRELYNRTAESLGLGLPLTESGWYEVKRHLRGIESDSTAASLTKDEAVLNMMACADLEIDPLPEKLGPVTLFLLWILSPSDRHGRLSEFLRMTTLVAISFCATAAALGVASFLGWAQFDLYNTIANSSLVLVLLGFVISMDTQLAALGLYSALFGLCSLVSGHWGYEWWKVGLSGAAVLLGGALVRGGLRI